MTLGLLLLILYISLTLASIWKFDRLAKSLYERHRDEWERNGRPQGIFWSHSETDIFSFAATITRLKCCISWFFFSPAWIKKGSEEAVDLLLYRIFSFAALPALFAHLLASMYFSK